MVKAGEESGKLVQTFTYLADYLDRQYELTSKTRNALIYPAFVILVFITVMILMFVVVIPKLSQIIVESGQEIPVYTTVVIGISNFFVNYGLFLLIGVVAFGVYVWWFAQSDRGRKYLDQVKLSIPFAGNLFTKLYLSRISDNMETMLTSGIPIVRSIEITAQVVGNRVYRDIMLMSAEKVKSGSSLADSVDRHVEIPSIMVQMIKVGEETGSVGMVLKTLGKFYKREVDDAVDTLVGLIEPFMIVMLGVGVGILLTSVLVPIYNIASGIS
jgi:type IV pilus assembly protein PilC